MKKIYNKNFTILFICSLILFFQIFTSPSYSQGKIIFKEVVVTGVGQSQEEALSNALAEAISSVNGKNVQTQTIIKIMGGEAIPKPSKNENLNLIFEKLKNISLNLKSVKLNSEINYISKEYLELKSHHDNFPKRNQVQNKIENLK